MVFHAEPDLDEDEKLKRLDEAIFNAPLCLAEWQISTSPRTLQLGDSQRLTFDIRPGRYWIRTQTFDPDPEPID